MLAVLQLQALYQRRLALEQHGAAIVRAIGAPMEHQYLVAQPQRALLEPVAVTADRIGAQGPLCAWRLGVLGASHQSGISFAIVENQIK